MATSEIYARVGNALREREIPFAAVRSTDYDSWHMSWTGFHQTKKPRLIVRPRNSADVADSVAQCTANGLPIVVRGGGHDPFGRFAVADAISIDLRDLDSVQVAPDRKSVSVGGGVTHLQLLEALEPHGLQAPVGSCGTVGYVGWCLIGGTGPYVHSYGLGADQIIGAKMVNADGQVVHADERMLKGLRGGGANLGIVVELTVKVYTREEVQAGLIVYESSDIGSTVATFFANYERLFSDHKKIPSKLYTVPSIWRLPDVGLVVMCAVTWNGPADDEFRVWVARIGRLATCMPGMPDAQAAIQPTTALNFSRMVTDMLPKRAWGRSQTLSVSHFSAEVIAGMVDLAKTLPANSTGGVNVLPLRQDSPSCAADPVDSVCPYREPQHILELLGLAADEESAAASAAWSLSARNRLCTLNGALKRTYLPLTSPEFVDLESIYGEQLAELKEIKKEYDPRGVFCNALPKLV